MAEAISMLLYYPYEIVKCRYVAKNEIYGYKSIPDAFKKIINKEGILGLYSGSNYFLINYIFSYSI